MCNLVESPTDGTNDKNVANKKAPKIRAPNEEGRKVKVGEK